MGSGEEFYMRYVLASFKYVLVNIGGGAVINGGGD